MENEQLQPDPVIVQQPNAFTAAQPAHDQLEDVKGFFKNDLLRMVRTIFTEPIKGTLEIFSASQSRAYLQALILIALTTLVYIIIPFLMAGSEIREALGFGAFVKLGLFVALVLLIISGLSFVSKAISGKPDFKKELLTGALCGIPLIVFILVMSVIMIFKGGSSISDFALQSLMGQGIFIGLVSLYTMLMIFNIVQQSFKASGTNDALSWYLSPLVVSVAFYIGIRLAASLTVSADTGF